MVEIAGYLSKIQFLVFLGTDISGHHQSAVTTLS